MDKYSNNTLLINLTMKGDIIASALYFESGDSVGAILTVLSLINFYNTNLCSKKYTNEEFALLFLSMNKELKDFENSIGLMENSYNYFLSKVKPSILPVSVPLNVEDIETYYYSILIAINEKDINFILGTDYWEVDSMINIDINSFNMDFDICAYLGYDAASIMSEDDETKIYQTDIDFENIQCNQLEDLKELFELADDEEAYIIKGKSIYEPYRTTKIR